MITMEITDALPEATHALRQEVFIDEQGFAQEFDERDRSTLHIIRF